MINELPSVNKKVDPEKKPINYNTLDWAFKQFITIQEDMIAKGHIDAAIKNLEDELNDRL